MRPRAFFNQLLSWLREPGLAARAEPASRTSKPPELMTHDDWVRHRAPVRHRDLTLSDTTVRWLRRLPEPLWPLQLCEHFPRIANRLALLWRDPGLVEHFLAELIQPLRPDREGFPAGIGEELVALQRLNEERLHVLEETDSSFGGAAQPASRS